MALPLPSPNVAGSTGHITTLHDTIADVLNVGELAAFSLSGSQTAPVVGKGTMMWPFAVTILGVSAVTSTAVATSAFLFDLTRNGTTMFTTQGTRPTIAVAATATSAEAVPQVTAVSAGQKLTVDFDQGTLANGDVATVIVRWRKA